MSLWFSALVLKYLAMVAEYNRQDKRFWMITWSFLNIVRNYVKKSTDNKKWSLFPVINIKGDVIFFWKLYFILIISTYLITKALSLQIQK